MPLRHILKRKLISCDAKTLVSKAAAFMTEFNVGAIVVLNGDLPEGILTDRDIVIRCVGLGRNCEKVQVGEVMSAPVACASLSDGIFDIVRIMKDRSIRRVPIVDEEGDAVGLLSFGDIMNLLGQEIWALCDTVTPEKAKLNAVA